MSVCSWRQMKVADAQGVINLDGESFIAANWQIFPHVFPDLRSTDSVYTMVNRKEII